ncbi:hypothetical protein V8E54_006665 [Elaphomyces granulatus]
MIFGTSPKERTPQLPHPLYLGLQGAGDVLSFPITNTASDEHLQSHANPMEIDPELLNPSPLPMSGGVPVQSTLQSVSSGRSTPTIPPKKAMYAVATVCTLWLDIIVLTTT